MANRILLGQLEDATEFGLLVSKPGVDVITHAIDNGESKDLLFDSRVARTGQVYAGGINLTLTTADNFLTTGSKSSLGYIPLVIATEKFEGYVDVGEAETGGEEVQTDNSFFKTTDSTITPVQINVNVYTSNPASPGASVPAPATGRLENSCTNCSYFVLRIPCAYGYMTSGNFS